MFGKSSKKIARGKTESGHGGHRWQDEVVVNYEAKSESSEEEGLGTQPRSPVVSQGLLQENSRLRRERLELTRSATLLEKRQRIAQRLAVKSRLDLASCQSALNESEAEVRKLQEECKKLRRRVEALEQDSCEEIGLQVEVCYSPD